MGCAVMLTGSAHGQSSFEATPTPRNSIAAPVDLDGTIRVESRSIGSDGVTRSSVYDETFMRRGQQVWTQRILPKQALRQEHGKDEKSKHKHLDPFAGGRLITLTDGKLEMRLVLPNDNAVVSVPSVEFGNLGFDGSWERAYALVTQQELRKLQPSSRATDIPGAQWFERKGDIKESVLWDKHRMVARAIESSNSQGTQWRRVTLTLNSTISPTVPWDAQRIKAFDRLQYSDFLD